jgi:hypothetical protein
MKASGAPLRRRAGGGGEAVAHVLRPLSDYPRRRLIEAPTCTPGRADLIVLAAEEADLLAPCSSTMAAKWVRCVNEYLRRPVTALRQDDDEADADAPRRRHRGRRHYGRAAPCDLATRRVRTNVDIGQP